MSSAMDWAANDPGAPASYERYLAPAMFEPLAEAGGELCEPEQGPPREAAKAARIAATEDRSKLKPLRWIHDPYAAYSSVAVDPINNEVVLTDENLFQILVYDRTTTLPATQTLATAHGESRTIA